MGYSERETALLEGQRVGRLASIGRGGEIHLVPMCYAFDSKSIYTSTAVNSWKVRNLKARPQATFLIDIYFEDWGKLRGLMLIGPTEILESGKDYADARKLLYGKYPQLEALHPVKEGETAIIKLTPQKVRRWDYGG